MAGDRARRVIERAEETLASILDEGGEASVMEADVTVEAECQGIIQQAVECYGSLNILFNNVAVISSGTVVDVEEQEWDRVMRINLKSMMLCCKYSIPRMLEAGRGSIINASSIAGAIGVHDP